MFDVLIRGGSVLDGTGAEAAEAEIGIRDGTIAALGRLEGAEAGTVIEAGGRTVCPGFVDIHRHGDLAVFRRGFGELELRQGLTTIVNGNCGMSAAPFGPVHRREILNYLSPVLGQAEDLPSASMDAYLKAVEALALPLNVGTLVGSGVVRADAAGFVPGPLDPARLRAVQDGLGRALADGALGVSLGLGYAPDCFYDLAAMAEALAPLRGGKIPLTVHVRDEGTNVDRSVEEMLALGRALGCPLEISHLKAIGRENWGRKIPRVLELLRRARAEGQAVRWDVYPYTAGSTQLLHILPPEVLAGGTEALTEGLADPGLRRHIRARLADGADYNNISKLVGWENILLSSLSAPENLDLVGKSLAEAAALRGRDPAELAMDVLRADRCAVTMIDFITQEADVETILRSEAVSLISDATYPASGLPHPRLYGAFVRLIDRYVNQKPVLTLAQAVHRMTMAPAQALGLGAKGRIAPGADADLLIFDPGKLRELGTYEAPARFPLGMDTVLVAGIPVLWEGRRTDVAPGRVLRR